MLGAIREHLPVFLILIPLVTAFILPTMARRSRLAEGFALLSSLLTLAGSFYLAYLFWSSGSKSLHYFMGGYRPPWGIELVVDHLAIFFLLVINLVNLPVLAYSQNRLGADLGSKDRIVRFYALYLLLIGSLSGMALTRDLFNVFVLVEVATISCCSLVSARTKPQAAKAAFSYLILATLGSSFILAGIGLIYILTGQLNMGFAGQDLALIWQQSPRVVWLAFSFFLVGFGVKSAIFPLHVWLPDAHSAAPGPASAILSGLAVKGYIICLLKILSLVFGQNLLQNFTVPSILRLAGVISILAGSVLALLQVELKRRLAYSTIAQLGYIFLGLGLMNGEGLGGGLFYLASHALTKALLFLAASSLEAASGKKEINALAGLGRKMPWTMACFTVASMSLIGIPLFSGFIGKWQLLLGSISAGSVLAAGSIILGSILCAAYLLPIIRIAYFDPQETPMIEESSPMQKLSLGILALAILVLGIFPGPLLELASKAGAELFTWR